MFVKSASLDPVARKKSAASQFELRKVASVMMLLTKRACRKSAFRLRGLRSQIK